MKISDAEHKQKNLTKTLFLYIIVFVKNKCNIIIIRDDLIIANGKEYI